MKFRTKCRLISLIIGTLTSLGSFVPAQAAQTINFITPSPLKFSLSISSLETFAADGIVDRSLADYMRFAGANEEEKERFREILLRRAEIDPIVLSRLLRTDMGEDMLSRWGQHIAVQGGRNGKYALRGALIKSAFDDNGLSLINVLRHLPTNIEIDLRRALSLANRVDLIITATNFFHDEIFQLAQQEVVNASPVDFTKLPDLRQPGELGVERKRWELKDLSRERIFEVDLYQPEKWRTGQTPVVIISHGLSDSPQNYADYAEHLASYGYLVAVPQHPGSDSQQLQALKVGLSRQIFLTSEFIDRPQDLSYVIDELERRNKADFGGKLDLNRVAVIGHSFGGYTALAIAGAAIDFEHLKQECERYLNLSLLLQCQALRLELNTDNLKDERIKAIGITNPLKSAIFGPSGLASVSLPVFVQAGIYDPLTPFVLEQVRPFPWLNTPNKYLSVQEGDIHVNTSNLDAGMESLIDSFTYLSLPESALLTSYNQAFLLAFLEVHLLDNKDFLPYMQSAYAEYLSQGEEFRNFLITNDSIEGLEEAITRFLAQHPSLEF